MTDSKKLKTIKQNEFPYETLYVFASDKEQGNVTYHLFSLPDDKNVRRYHALNSPESVGYNSTYGPFIAELLVIANQSDLEELIQGTAIEKSRTLTQEEREKIIIGQNSGISQMVRENRTRLNK